MKHASTNKTKKRATAEEDNINVAKSLLRDLQALGFADAVVGQSDTRLRKIICSTIGKVPLNAEDAQLNASIYQPSTNEQLRSDQTVPKSANQWCIITASAENPTISHLETPSILTKISKKRKRESLKYHGQPIMFNIEASTSSGTSVPAPQNDGNIAQAEGQHFLADIPSHLEQRTDITSCLEGRKMQHGDIMDVDNVVDAYESPRGSDTREVQRIEDGESVRNPCSRPVANATTAEHRQTLVVIADSVVAGNDTSYSPRPFGQDGPEHSRSPSVFSPPSPDVIGSVATALVGVSGEETTLAESTRQTLLPREFVCTPSCFMSLICRTGATPKWHNVVLGANGICDYLFSDVT
jgi:hypothetical protein